MEMTLNCTDVFSNNPIKQFVDTGLQRFRPGYSRERLCSHCSLYFVAEGEMHFTTRERDVSAQKNDIVFMKTDEVGRIANDSDAPCDLYYVAFRADEEWFSDVEFVTHVSGVAEVFMAVVSEYDSQAPLRGLKIAEHLYRILHLVASSKLYHDAEYMQYLQIRKAGEYINANYYKSITEESLCAIAGYSPSHLRRLFTKVYGCSPKEYILSKKLEHAKRILYEEPDKTVSEIAELLSFCTSTYFCYVFKKKLGLSPTEYRRSLRGSTII